MANSLTTSTTTAKRKGDITDPWCIPTLTSNSSGNSEFILTLVFAPSPRHITDLIKTSGHYFPPQTPFQHLPSVSQRHSPGPQNTYNCFPLHFTVLLIQPSQPTYLTLSKTTTTQVTPSHLIQPSQPTYLTLSKTTNTSHSISPNTVFPTNLSHSV